MVTEFFNVNDSIIAADWTLLNVTPIGRIGKGIKYVGKKAGKALLNVAKKVPSKVKEGVSFVASKTKSLVDKVGDLWNKGKTKVKNDFIEADKAFRYAMKKLGEYVPKSGRELAFATESAGKISGRGKNLLKDAYQYMKETGEKVFGSGEKDVVKGANGAAQRTQKELDDLARDPSHGGKITEGSKLEREIGLALEQRGDLGKIVRDPNPKGGAEFIDTVTGKKYDVKSFESYPNGHTSPKKGAFTVERALKNMQKEFDKGYNVIVNTNNLIPQHKLDLIKVLKEKGLFDRVIFYP
ncbi:hypothetical protein [Bacillus arachidis]|uniref:hypothetical protein n=1 Tax=Bacillus arachidis TaxID=2819290 RepID=UPI00255C97B6|nr:hypothetical protein [Bacillus arachidis]WIY63169.1 hypothetical protein QRY57_12220 [Bacillus arachidis]